MKTNLQTNLTAGGSASNSSAAAKFLSLRQLCARHLKMAINFIMPFLLCSVMSFNATAQDYSITTTGNAIVLTDISGNGDTLFVSQSGTNMRFLVKPTSRTYSVDGGPVTAFSTPAGAALAGNYGVSVFAAKISGGTAGTLIVNGTGGASTDQLNYGVVISSTNSIITSSGGNVSVTGLGGGSGASNSNVGVYASRGNVTAGGSGTVSVRGTGGLGTGVNNYGIAIESGTITSTSGNVSVTGQGGSSGSAAGIAVSSSGRITAGNNASVTVHGAGGPSSGYGVWLAINGTITSSGGNVNVTGQGNGNNGNSWGISLQGSGVISAGGNCNSIWHRVLSRKWQLWPSGFRFRFIN